jgi:hypothetical protein
MDLDGGKDHAPRVTAQPGPRMTIIHPRGQGSRSDVPLTRGERIASIATGAVALAAVALLFAAPALIIPLIVAVVALRLSLRAWRDERGARRTLLAALPIVGGATALLLFGSDTGWIAIAGIITAAFSIFSGAVAGFGALGSLAHVFDLAPFSEPILFGILSGAVVAALQNLRRWRASSRATDSVVTSALSGDRWTRTIATLQIFAIGIAASYLASLLLESVGLFHGTSLDAVGTATQMWGVVTGGAGGGLGGDATGLLNLLLVLLALFATLLGFGFVIGVCVGAPFGAIGAYLSWQHILHGAAAAGTRHLIHRPPGAIFTAIFRGAAEGGLSGIIAAWLLAALHLVHIC